MQSKTAWHDEENGSDEAGKRLWDVIGSCGEVFSLRKWEATELYRMYKGDSVGGKSRIPLEVGDGSTEPIYPEQVTQILNFSKDLVDTAVAKLCKENQKPQLVATETSWETKRRMRLADRFVEGQMQQKQGRHQNHWAVREHCLRLALGATRTAAIKFYWDDAEMRVREEVHDTLSMVMDTTASAYDEPTWLAERQSWDPYCLSEQFPDDKQAIFDAAVPVQASDHLFGLEAENEEYGGFAGKHEVYRVEVVEGWYFAKGERKGRHVIRIDGATLLDEEYLHPDSPFVFIGGVRDMTGQWHQTLTKHVAGAICKVNELLEDIDFQRLFSPPRVRYYDPEVHNQAELQTTSDEVEMIPVVGLATGTRPPIDAVPQAFNQQLLDLVQFFVDFIYGLPGINRFNTAGQISGDWSGVALRLMKDQLVERFASVQKELIEATVVESTHKILRVAKAAALDGASDSEGNQKKKIKTTWRSETGMMREIDVSVLSVLDDMEFSVTTYPVSEKKNTPEDRVQLFEDLTRAGITSGDSMISIIKYYDTVGTVGTGDDAQRRNIEEQIDDWLHAEPEDMQEPGWYIGPIRSMNAVTAIVQVNTAYLNALTDRVDDSRLEYFERFIAQAEKYLGEREQRMGALADAGVQPGPTAPMNPQATGAPPGAPGGAVVAPPPLQPQPA